MYSLIWYIALAFGVTRIYGLALRERRSTNALEKSRLSAAAFLVCGQLLWFWALLDDLRREVRFTPSNFHIMDLLGVLGGSIGWMIFLIGPTWLPGRLLRGNPGVSRCGFAAFVSRAVAFFAGAVICFAPVMFLFAGSLGEFIGANLFVSIPMLIMIYFALKAGKAASRAADAIERGAGSQIE